MSYNLYLRKSHLEKVFSWYNKIRNKIGEFIMFNLKKYNQEMDKVFDYFKDNLKSVRTGRAHTSMLDGVMVEAYGTSMPLNQTANITVSDAQMLLVTPFDVNNLEAIVAAIRNNQTLGLNPTDDGKNIRVPIPPLTEERRLQMVKQVKTKVEEAKVSVRNIRHDAIKEVKNLKNDKKISEDDQKLYEKQIQDLVDQTQDNIDKLFAEKEQEMTTV